jgi:hypothetical protein
VVGAEGELGVDYAWRGDMQGIGGTLRWLKEVKTSRGFPFPIGPLVGEFTDRS